MSAVGLVDTASTSRENREQLIKQWLNMEEDPSVIDAKVLDYVSDPVHLDWLTSTPASASNLNELRRNLCSLPIMLLTLLHPFHGTSKTAF